jgi:hypothetical protein
MNYFLITYDRSSGELTDLREFTASERDVALQERFALERAHRRDTDVEVVLVGSESLDALKQTHSRYFKTAGELAEAL